MLNDFNSSQQLRKNQSLIFFSTKFASARNLPLCLLSLLTEGSFLPAVLIGLGEKF